MNPSATVEPMHPLPPRPAAFITTFWAVALASLLPSIPLNTGSPPSLLLVAMVWFLVCTLLSTAVWMGWGWLALRFAASRPAAASTPAPGRLRTVRWLALATFAALAACLAFTHLVGLDRALRTALGVPFGLAFGALIWLVACGISESEAAPNAPTLRARFTAALCLLSAPYFAVVLYNRLKALAAQDAPIGRTPP